MASSDKIPMTGRLIGSGIEVSFELTPMEYVYYKLVRGLITEQEAREALGGRELDPYQEHRMDKFARQLS